MASAIDTTQPPAVAPSTAAMRANMLAAKVEIEALQQQQKFAIGIKERFFASLPNSVNHRSRQYLKEPVPWSANISVISGFACTNAGNLYICAYDDQKTSTIAPTHTSYSTVPVGADGVHWLYMGSAPAAQADQSNTPIYSIAAVPSACSLRIDPNPVVFPANAIDYNTYLFSGSDFEPKQGDGGGTNGVAALNYSSSAFVDFMTDAPIFAMNRLQNAGSLTFSLAQGTTINGFPMWPNHALGEPLSTPYTSNSNLAQVFDFTAKPTRPRRIRQWLSNKVFTGVWIPPQYSIWKPVNPARWRLYTEGDSFMQGGKSSDGGIKLIGRLAAALGCDDVWSSAAGNTGYIWSGGGSNLQTRSGKVITAAPDVIFCHGTNWDDSYTSLERKNAYKQYWDTLLTALPDLIIFTVGGRSVISPARLDMLAAVGEYAHPHVVYIDAYGNTGATAQTLANQLGKGWFTGDGSLFTAGTVQGNTQIILGSGDTADEHPNIRGDILIEQRIFDAIVDAMHNL